MKTLIVVESPTKARTIKNYLPEKYQLFATMGHIKDLAIKGINGYGVLIYDGFKAEYETIKGKTNTISKLKEFAKDKKVLLASDYDREGEAIAWHVKEELKLDEDDVNRIRFTEITKEAILEAIENPASLDKNLVNSQETRRILDRIIGFDLSKLVQRKIHSISAGRVQSVVLKMIIDREKEISDFKPLTYYQIEADFKKFKAQYIKNKDKTLRDENEAKALVKEMGTDFIVTEIEEKEALKYSLYPFITSTLQQQGIYRLRTSASNVMKIAQKLYEGVKTKDGMVGLITYMRTDSLNLSSKFVNITRDYIKKTYGEEYLGTIRRPQARKGAQEAHEAIRPTSIYRTPESVKPYLSNQEYKLYELIYKRTLAFLMKAGLDLEKSVTFNANGHLFKANFTKVVFLGHRLLEKSSKKEFYPSFQLKETLSADKVELIKKETEAPKRYTEATLIKEMEDSGIGRPSTYAETTRRINSAGYVYKEKGYFHPSEQGKLTATSLDNYFNEFINVNYTSKMETSLDEIASGETTKEEVLTNFYDNFYSQVLKATKEMPTLKKEVKKTGEKCPLCGKDLVYKQNRKGETFIACSGFTDT
ncbi:MAG: type I DNA topoisomerase, partial [Acholeplasmataceae bacterium]|nr:type I DNA topoisomerase [Acholeplasmataceae bacterium]